MHSIVTMITISVIIEFSLNTFDANLWKNSPSFFRNRRLWTRNIETGMIYTHLSIDWLDDARARHCTQQNRFLHKHFPYMRYLLIIGVILSRNFSLFWQSWVVLSWFCFRHSFLLSFLPSSLIQLVYFYLGQSLHLFFAK